MIDLEKLPLLGGGVDITGREVDYWGDRWTITGKGLYGWNVQRFEIRSSGRVQINSNIDFKILPELHPHFALLVPTN